LATSEGGLAKLTNVKAEKVLLASDQGDLYALTYQQSQARTELLRIPRGGGTVEKVGALTGVGEPSQFVIGGNAAYFARKRSVFRVGLTDREMSEVAQDVAPALAVTKAGLYVVRCDRTKGDTVVRMDGRGGAAETVAEISAASKESCNYKYMAADERDVFVSDWRDRRILAVSLGDKSVRTLATVKAFPLRLVLEPDHVVFQSAAGLSRVSRDGGAVTSLSAFGVVPFSTFVADDSMFWIFSEIRFTDVAGLYAVPKAGGQTKPQKAFAVLAPPDALNVTGFLDLATDDQCLYFARYGHAGQDASVVSILAKRK
jgi:hypothetical protein